MTTETDPSSFLWRLVPIGFATVFAGGVPIVALGGILGRAGNSEIIETVAIIVAMLFVLALFIFAPMYVVWSSAFVLLRRHFPNTRYRAALSTFLCVLIANGSILALLLSREPNPNGRTIAKMALLTVLTTLVGVGLTWRAFRSEART